MLTEGKDNIQLTCFPMMGQVVVHQALETTAQIQSLARANDPVYEMGFRFMGGSSQQEKIWRHVLTRLAAQFDVPAQITMQKLCVDNRMQWSQAKNVWHNAMIRSTLNLPARTARRLFGR